MTHTTGLYAAEEGGNWRVMADDENGGYTIADMCGDNQEENARLFAAAPELLEVADENEMLKKAYRKMRNSAAGYSNFCEESENTRRCDREYEEAESLFYSIDA